MTYFFQSYASHYKALGRLGLPIVIGQIGQIVLGFADTMMIGHHSTAELGAAAFVNTMFNLILIAALGFSYGMTPVVGSFYGQKDTVRIGETVKNGLLANTLLAIVLLVLMYVFYLNLGNLGQPEELLPLMRPYFIVQLVSLAFVLWFNCLKQFFDGITQTVTPMWVMLSGNIINIVGNWLLIYGVAGLPELGLLGAGIATLLARVYMSVMLAAVFLWNRRFAAYRQAFVEGKVNRSDFVKLNKLGFPLALQMGMETASFSLTSMMVGWIGTTALAAHQIMLTVSQVCFMMYYGMAAAVAVRISFFCGMKNYPSLLRTSYAGFHLVLFLAVCGAIPIFLLRHVIGYWFTSDVEVATLVAATVIPFVIYQFGDGMQCNYANALRGLSYVKPMMYIAFLAYFVVSLPLSYVFGIVMGGGLAGIWWAFPFGLTTAGVLYYWVFMMRFNKLNR